MIKFNKYIISNVMKKQRVLFTKGHDIRKFCEKNKLNIVEEKKEFHEEQIKKRNFYTFLRKIRKWLKKILTFGLIGYGFLLFGNYFIYKKTPYVEKYLSFMKYDYFQSTIRSLISVKRRWINVSLTNY